MIVWLAVKLEIDRSIILLDILVRKIRPGFLSNIMEVLSIVIAAGDGMSKALVPGEQETAIA